jgi:hypothetical protein
MAVSLAVERSAREGRPVVVEYGSSFCSRGS